METAIVSLICIALIVFGGMTMSQGFLTSVDSTTAGLEEMSNTSGEIMRTELSAQDASWDNGQHMLDVTLRNTGQTKVASLDKWDVIIQYYDDGGGYHVLWLPYTTGNPPGIHEWTVTGIYLDGQPEAFEPNIINPGEDVVMQIQPLSLSKDFTNLVTISTPNGIPASISFEN